MAELSEDPDTKPSAVVHHDLEEEKVHHDEDVLEQSPQGRYIRVC